MTDSGGTVSWAELLRETETRLDAAGHGSDSRAEARWIVEEATGRFGDELLGMLSEPATVRGVAHLDAMVERRSGGEPIQYVLGHWAFRRLDLLVDRRVLIPRPETEVLVERVLAELDRMREPGLGTVVDLGTGSGAIGLSVAMERPGTRVVLTDASEEAIAVARANLAGLGMAGGSVEISVGEWFTALPDRLRGECDVVVSNPPYVRSADALPDAVVNWEPAMALRAGPDGLDHLRVLVAGAGAWLRPTGALVLEMDPSQTGPVAELAAAAGFRPTVHKDLAGRDRIVVATRAST